MGEMNLIPADYIQDALFLHEITPGYLGYFLDVNNIACQRLGYTREELLTMTPVDIDDPDSEVDLTPFMTELAKGNAVLFVQVHVTKDGRKIPVEVHAHPAKWEGKSVVVSVVRDLTLRKQAEIERRLEEENFRLAFEQALVGQVMISPQGRFLEVNHMFAEMLGYTDPDALIDKHVSEITYPDDMTQTNALFHALLDEGAPLYRIKKRYYHKDGHLVWGEVSTVLLRNSDGSPRHFITQILDITEQLKTAEIIRQGQDRLEAIVEERTRQLQESNAALQSFAYAASHDLREPLIKISAFGQRLEEKYSDNLDDKGKQYLQIMQTASTRMLRLIDDILAYSRVTREDSPLTDVKINDVLTEVISDLEVSISEAKAVITVGTLPTVRAHPIRMRQVFQNLISNAIKFRKPGLDPEISIDSEVKNGVATLVVKDNGIGFEPQHAERIFTIFTRLHTRFEYPGTGIGLALCRRILDQYDGSIMAQGEPDVGSTFTIQIPITKEITTIIVVDDHDVVLQGVRSILAPEKDLKVVGMAQDGATALMLIKQTHPDFVILDANLPDVSGMDVLQQILTQFPDIKVICLSIGPHRVVGPMMLEAGAVAYIRKEDHLQGLVDTIRKFL